MATAVSARTRITVRLGLLLCVLGLFGFVLWAVRTYPPTSAAVFYPKCQLHEATGLHCPGCGLTRFVYALTEGDLLQAAAWNVLGFVLLPWLLWMIGSMIFSALFPSKKPSFQPVRYPRLRVVIAVTAAVVLCSFGILRNIPIEPFTWLAPHEVTR